MSEAKIIPAVLGDEAIAQFLEYRDEHGMSETEARTEALNDIAREWCEHSNFDVKRVRVGRSSGYAAYCQDCDVSSYEGTSGAAAAGLLKKGRTPGALADE